MPSGFKKDGTYAGKTFQMGHIPWHKGKKGLMPIPWNKDKKGVMPIPKNKIPEEKKPKINCKQCNKIIVTYPSFLPRKKFCSIECRNIWYKGKHYSPQTEIKEGVHHSLQTEFKKGHTITSGPKKLRELMQNPEWKEKQIEKVLNGLKIRPTSLDKQFNNDFIIKFSLPYKYVGDGTFRIGYKIPDFVNVNGEKTCVEVRSIEVTKYLSKLTKEEYEQQRKEYFAKWGWKCLVFFANQIKSKIWKFEKPNEEILNELRGNFNG